MALQHRPTRWLCLAWRQWRLLSILGYPVAAKVAEAQAALARLRGATVLERTDVDAVVDVLVRFSELCVDLQDIVTEIDLNPLIVRSIDQGAIAVDSLFALDRSRAQR